MCNRGILIFFLLLTRGRGILVIAVLIFQKLLGDITSGAMHRELNPWSAEIWRGMYGGRQRQCWSGGLLTDRLM